MALAVLLIELPGTIVTTKDYTKNYSRLYRAQQLVDILQYLISIEVSSNSTNCTFRVSRGKIYVAKEVSIIKKPKKKHDQCSTIMIK